MSPILFDTTYLAMFDYQEFSKWNDGITRYMFEIASELDLQRPKECCYVSAFNKQVTKERIEQFKKDKRFPPWKFKTEKIAYKERVNWFFPNTYYPFPEDLKRYSQIQFFVGVFDLIPFFFPEHFTSKFNVAFRNSLKSYCKEDRIHFLCISESTKRDLCKVMDLDSNKASVVPLAADKKVFFPCYDNHSIEQVKSKYSISNKPYFLCLSRFVERKNPLLVLKSFSLFLKKHKNSEMKLVFAGLNVKTTIKNYFDEAIQFILKEGIQDRIHWVEFVEEDDLHCLYSGAQACFFPSLYEGFGLTILEAMQCGAPVVASNNSSIPEVVGEAGILLPVEDESAWAQAMIKIHESKELQKELSKKSLERALLFSWENTVSKMLEVFESVQNTCSKV
jgi:glycosyltransferase involved in cell wall biosynthesis